MKAHNKDFTGSPRILEINPDHKLIKEMASQISGNADPELIEDAANSNPNQAQILEDAARQPHRLCPAHDTADGTWPVGLKSFRNTPSMKINLTSHYVCLGNSATFAYFQYQGWVRFC